VQEFLLSGLRKTVEKTADEFDPGLLSGVTATQAVEHWAAIERVAGAQKLRAAARADEVGIDAEGIVADASGITQTAARKQTRLASRVKGKTKAAFEKGKLSAQQAKAIADAVEANPAAEDDLLGLAAAAPACDLLRECDRIRRDAMDSDGSLAAKQRAARCLKYWTDTMGMLCISARLEPVAGAKLVAELTKRADRMFRAQVRAKGGVDTVEQRMADALSEIVDSCDATAAGKRRGPRTEVFLFVSKAAAERGWLEPGEKCETADGQPIPLGAIDDALLDPDTKTTEVEVDAVDVRAIKTNTRYFPARLMDALIARGKVCSEPGCGRTRGLERDHTQDFAKGGPTSLANATWKCHYHHDRKSRGLDERAPP
jgi:hypothetical protein